MHIQMFSRSENQLERNEYNDLVIIKFDGQFVFQAKDGELEDNNLCRNFQSIYNIPNLLKQAYNAGKRGEEFTLEICDLEE